MTEPDVVWPPSNEPGEPEDDFAAVPVWLTPPPEPDPED